MERTLQVAEILAAFRHQAPAGYAAALHMKFTTPGFLFQTYPSGWNAEYSAQGFVMEDPTVHWGLHNEGHVLWSDLTGNDPAGVLARAAAHGLTHGFTAALVREGTRSLAGFARGDRPFEEAEIAAIIDGLERLHTLTADAGAMLRPEAAALRALAVNQTQTG